jgi:hypothetical protein
MQTKLNLDSNSLVDRQLASFVLWEKLSTPGDLEIQIRNIDRIGKSIEAIVLQSGHEQRYDTGQWLLLTPEICYGEQVWMDQRVKEVDVNAAMCVYFYEGVKYLNPTFVLSED